MSLSQYPEDSSQNHPSPSAASDTVTSNGQCERWRARELIVLVFVSIVAAWLFRDGSLDLFAARFFYHPESTIDHWFEQNEPLWVFFYQAAPWFTALLLLGSLAVQCWGMFDERLRRFRRDAILVFLVVALGPGLFVNALFKPYWGRPRPREVVQLGGKQEYRPFYSPSVGSPGKSFPCGHCSIGYAFGAFWWIALRRRGRPTWTGGLALSGALTLGTVMGVARMAAGGHFLSDVVWAGLMVFWVGHWTNFYLLEHWWRRRPAEEKAIVSERRKLSLAVYGALAVVTVAVILFASPFHNEVHLVAQPADGEMRLEFDIDQARIDLVLDEHFPATFEIAGYAKGFGFPGGKLAASCERQILHETCSLKRRGYFSDYESVIRVVVNPRKAAGLILRTRGGEVYRDPEKPLPPEFLIELQ